jgi:hypothetical protein
MKHPIYKITSVKNISDYTLELIFNDGLMKRIDFEPVLHGEIYSPLREKTLFNKVKIDKEVSTIVWPNGADFEPALLHDWEKYIDELKERVKNWAIINPV